MKFRKSMTALLIILTLTLLFTACTSSPTGRTIDEVLEARPDVQTNAPLRGEPYSEALERKIAAEIANEPQNSQRPDYLPEIMFSLLPPMPKDFYAVRELIRLGRITDLENLEEQYWQQPEFFPNFESLGVPILQNPPEDRWGAYGLASFPAEAVATLRIGDTLETYFWMRSNYLVETFQGVNLQPKYPASQEVTSGVLLPDGSRSVTQSPAIVQNYFEVEVDPQVFILEPNFPLFRPDGTKKVKVSIRAKSGTPPGNYIVALDTAAVSKGQEELWSRQYLNRYASGGLTKLDKPFYTVFVTVGGEQ